jgi:hypothetical protein
MMHVNSVVIAILPVIVIAVLISHKAKLKADKTKFDILSASQRATDNEIAILNTAIHTRKTD